MRAPLVNVGLAGGVSTVMEDVNNIAILKGTKGNRLKYNTIVCSRGLSKLVWSISILEDDNYEGLYKVIDYYVHKYGIEVTLESTLHGSVQRLDGMPKKLDFLNI